MNKKIFVLTLSALIAFSSNAFANENNKYEVVGNALKKVNVIKGNENGLEIDKKLTKKEAIVVLARMLGKEEEAKNTIIDYNFKDVPKDDFYAPYISWAKKEGIITGNSDEEFGFNDEVSTKVMITLSLRALGYTEEAKWTDENNIYENARKIGIIKDVEIVENKNILRGEMFQVLYNTLLTNPKNETSNLAKKLKINDEILKKDVVNKKENVAKKKTVTKVIESSWTSIGSSSSSSSNTPSNPSEPKPNTPSNPSESKPNTPSNPSESKPNTPSNPSESKPNTPSNPSESKPNTPSNPSESKPNTPSNPSESKPNTPSNPSEPKPNTPSSPSEPKPEVQEKITSTEIIKDENLMASKDYSYQTNVNFSEDLKVFDFYYKEFDTKEEQVNELIKGKTLEESNLNDYKKLDEKFEFSKIEDRFVTLVELKNGKIEAFQNLVILKDKISVIYAKEDILGEDNIKLKKGIDQYQVNLANYPKNSYYKILNLDEDLNNKFIKGDVFDEIKFKEFKKLESTITLENGESVNILILDFSGDKLQGYMKKEITKEDIMQFERLSKDDNLLIKLEKGSKKNTTKIDLSEELDNYYYKIVKDIDSYNENIYKNDDILNYKTFNKISNDKEINVENGIGLVLLKVIDNKIDSFNLQNVLETEICYYDRLNPTNIVEISKLSKLNNDIIFSDDVNLDTSSNGYYYFIDNDENIDIRGVIDKNSEKYLSYNLKVFYNENEKNKKFENINEGQFIYLLKTKSVGDEIETYQIIKVDEVTNSQTNMNEKNIKSEKIENIIIDKN